jgi:hypothetical protein
MRYRSRQRKVATIKNRYRYAPTYWNCDPYELVVDKERPGPGGKHFLRRKDILDFISILPDWNELAKGLRAVVLAKYNPCQGWYSDRGIVAICAWPRQEWVEWKTDFYKSETKVLNRLEVDCQEQNDGRVLCKFRAAQIRAYQLLDVFLHELGHHHDRMTTRKKEECGRGESYADQYALKYEEIIWESYIETFGIPYWSEI